MVLPSEYEPFAVVVNEAMLCGCPVIVSDLVGAAQDLIAPVCREFIFPCGDIAALAALLSTIAKDRALLQGIRHLGLAHLQTRSEEHTSELQSRRDLVCRLLL